MRDIQNQTGRQPDSSRAIRIAHETPDTPGTPVSRREFLRTALAAGVGLATGAVGCSHLKSTGPADAPVAFVTANLVARVSGYQFELAHWGDQHKQTVAATDAAAWQAICREIRATGFRAIEIWEAHAAPEMMTRERGATWKSIMEDNGLRAIGYGGGLSRKTLEICQWQE